MNDDLDDDAPFGEGLGWRAFATLYLFILCVAALVLIMPAFFIMALHRSDIAPAAAVQSEAR